MTTIDLAPLVNGIVIPLLTPVLLAVIMWVATKVAALAHIQIQDSQRDVLTAAVNNGIAYAERVLAPRLGITADDKVATAVNYILPKIPDALKGLGITPDHLAQLVTARLPAPPLLTASGS